MLSQIVSNLERQSPPRTPPRREGQEPPSVQSPSPQFRALQTSPTIHVSQADINLSAEPGLFETSGIDDPALRAEGKPPLEHAATDLLKLIKAEPGSPLRLLLSFDEAELLAEPVDDASWTRLLLLQRVLRQLRDFPIFACALATTGKIQQFTPSPQSAISARLQKGILIFVPPFAALGFDQLVQRLEIYTLAAVTEIGFIATIGRPL
jgi:hypothetical protein